MNYLLKRIRMGNMFTNKKYQVVSLSINTACYHCTKKHQKKKQKDLLHKVDSILPENLRVNIYLTAHNVLGK